MAKALFFVEQISQEGEILTITGEEAKHISGARRLTVGDIVALTDGRGKRAEATLTATDKNSVTLNITSIRFEQKPEIAIHIATALPKGDRQSDLFDQCTQLGADVFIVLQSDYSISKVKENTLARFNRIIRSACKQSQRSHFPSICTYNSLSKLLQDIHEDYCLFYADADGRSLFELKEGIICCHRKWLCLIGPEGGFSQSERDLLEQSGFIGLSLGPYILRTETAAVVATAVLQQLRVRVDEKKSISMDGSGNDGVKTRF